MALFDHQGGADLPYPREQVFDALIQAIPTLKGMKVERADALTGFISAKAGVSLKSWGESIPISVHETAPGRTRVSITSTPKTGLLFGGAFDLGKNRANIEKILLATSDLLRLSPPLPSASAPTPSPNLDPAARIAKLKSLLEAGLIDQAEFEQRKREIVSEI